MFRPAIKLSHKRAFFQPLHFLAAKARLRTAPGPGQFIKRGRPGVAPLIHAGQGSSNSCAGRMRLKLFLVLARSIHRRWVSAISVSVTYPLDKTVNLPASRQVGRFADAFGAQRLVENSNIFRRLRAARPARIDLAALLAVGNQHQSTPFQCGLSVRRLTARRSHCRLAVCRPA